MGRARPTGSVCPIATTPRINDAFSHSRARARRQEDWLVVALGRPGRGTSDAFPMVDLVSEPIASKTLPTTIDNGC
jgi:hypothetical protein